MNSSLLKKNYLLTKIREELEMDFKETEEMKIETNPTPQNLVIELVTDFLFSLTNFHTLIYFFLDPLHSKFSYSIILF